MNEIKMTLLDANIEEFNVALEFEANVDGDVFGLTKNVRLGKWNEEDKCLEEDYDTKYRGMEQIKKYFDIEDLSDFAELFGNEYTFFLDDEGSIFFEVPEWYEEKKILDDLHQQVVKPDAKLADKASKGILEYVAIGKNGIQLFIEVTGKNGKGTHVVVNRRFGTYDKDNKFSRSYKKKIKQENALKTAFGINDVNELKDFVGQTVIINYEVAPNKSVFVSCSGLDE